MEANMVVGVGEKEWIGVGFAGGATAALDFHWLRGPSSGVRIHQRPIGTPFAPTPRSLSDDAAARSPIKTNYQIRLDKIH